MLSGFFYPDICGNSTNYPEIRRLPNVISSTASISPVWVHLWFYYFLFLYLNLNFIVSLLLQNSCSSCFFAVVVLYVRVSAVLLSILVIELVIFCFPQRIDLLNQQTDAFKDETARKRERLLVLQSKFPTVNVSEYSSHAITNAYEHRKRGQMNRTLLY